MKDLDGDASIAEVVPFYFGMPPKRLYGCHHLPLVSPGRAFAVVLCPAIAQEYIQSHRVIYKLAALLSKKGFHVLRFDYFGCGDSEGDFEQGSVAQWTADVRTAIEEIQNRSGLTKICLVGLRMGAFLALRAAAPCRDIDAIILWDPVLDGTAYLSELSEAQRSFLRKLASEAPWSFLEVWRHGISRAKQLKDREPDEALGFPMTTALRDELQVISVDASELPSEVRLLVLSHGEEPRQVSDCLERFASINPHMDFVVIPDQTKAWTESYRRIVPYQTLQYLVDWLDRVQS